MIRCRTQGRGNVYCLLGDGELDEGANHEAIALAGRRKLDNLVAIVIDNQSASQGWPGGIQRRFEVEGWAGRRVNGRDHAALAEALTVRAPGRPSALVALTEARQ